MNNPDSTNNTSLDALIAKMDLDRVKKDCNAHKEKLNGTRNWTVDWIEGNTEKAIKRMDRL